MALKIIEQYITKNQAYVANMQKADSRYTNFQKNGPKGAVLHSVGGNQKTAKAYADYFASPNREASVHAVIQGDGTCYKLAPWNFRMWHVGGSANNTHVGVEMVERQDDSIYYDSAWKLHVVDRDKALEYVKKVYNNAVELFAQLCIEFGWNPLEDGVILSHSECHKRGIGSGHADPEHLWNALNSGLTMDKFRQAVHEKVKAMKAEKEQPKEEPKPVERPKEETKEEPKMECNCKRYHHLSDVKLATYRTTLNKLVGKGLIKGKGFDGDDMILDMSEDAIRVLVTLDRAGMFEN